MTLLWEAGRLALMTDTSTPFSHNATFEQGAVSGNLRLGRLESLYEELFADVIEDGVITPDERQKLDKMAESLGLDRARLLRLEEALQAAYEAKHRVQIREVADGEERAGTLMPLEAPRDPASMALERRIKTLEGRIKELEKALVEAQNQVAVDVDLSEVAPATASSAEDDPVELQRLLRHDPRDASSLHALFRNFTKVGDVDRAFLLSQVTTYLGIATQEEEEVHGKYATGGLIQPKMSLSGDAWSKLLAHPEEESLIGEIFAVVAPAVLLGRISAMRRDKQLTKLDPARKQDVATSTIQSVRCIGWASSILGTGVPPIYADPEFPEAMDIVPGMPVATRIGQKALSGRSTTELAFLAGQHVTYHRAEHIIRALVPTVRDLEEIYLAALSIGNPGLPMNAALKRTVIPVAKAIEPILEPNAVDHLRGFFLRFVEEGGRANLGRWAASVEKTAARAGLLLANDLKAAETIFKVGLEADVPDAPQLRASTPPPPRDARAIDRSMDDLLAFLTSERCAKLRKQLGVAVA